MVLITFMKKVMVSNSDNNLISDSTMTDFQIIEKSARFTLNPKSLPAGRQGTGRFFSLHPLELALNGVKK